MYIRRKVFSMANDYDYLSEIEERAFCEGYEFAQREFGIGSKIINATKNGAKKALEIIKHPSEGVKLAKEGFENVKDTVTTQARRQVKHGKLLAASPARKICQTSAKVANYAKEHPSKVLAAAALPVPLPTTPFILAAGKKIDPYVAEKFPNKIDVRKATKFGKAIDDKIKGFFKRGE